VPAHLFARPGDRDRPDERAKSNVLFWLEKHRIPADDATVTRIFDAAKQSPRVLSDAEVLALCTEAHAIERETILQADGETRSRLRYSFG